MCIDDIRLNRIDIVFVCNGCGCDLDAELLLEEANFDVFLSEFAEFVNGLTGLCEECDEAEVRKHVL